MFPAMTLAAFLAGLPAAPTPAAIAAVGQPPETAEAETAPATLLSIMRELGELLQHTAGAIALGQWDDVDAAARRIADHPTPAFAEKARVMRAVGAGAGRFRAHDRAVHDAALVLADAARRRDAAAAIGAFADVQSGCLECHQAFRDDIRRHLHPAD